MSTFQNSPLNNLLKNELTELIDRANLGTENERIAKRGLIERQYHADIAAEFYLAMNMMYSDYYSVANRFGVNTVDFYSAMAKAFLDDKDAGEMKIEKYFEYVVD